MARDVRGLRGANETDDDGRIRQVEKKNQVANQLVTLTWTLGYDARDNLRSFKDLRNFERIYTYDFL